MTVVTTKPTTLQVVALVLVLQSTRLQLAVHPLSILVHGYTASSFSSSGSASVPRRWERLRPAFVQSTRATTTTTTTTIQNPTATSTTTIALDPFKRRCMATSMSRLYLSDWSGFNYDNDDDEIALGKSIDRQAYAVEDDAPEVKAAVGMERIAPTIERDADPIQVVAGSQLELSEENVVGVLSACRGELGTMFGYTAENRGVGITGGVDFVDLDGPTVIIKLKGRFWHTREMVLERVSNYLSQRIPEIVEVQIEDPWQLTSEANDVW